MSCPTTSPSVLVASHLALLKHPAWGECWAEHVAVSHIESPNPLVGDDVRGPPPGALGLPPAAAACPILTDFYLFSSRSQPSAFRADGLLLEFSLLPIAVFSRGYLRLFSLPWPLCWTSFVDALRDDDFCLEVLPLSGRAARRQRTYASRSLTWCRMHARIGEAANPGPRGQGGGGGQRAGAARLHGREDVSGRLADKELVDGHVNFRQAWESWAACISHEPPSFDGDMTAWCAGQLNAERLARSAMIELARRRARWHKEWANKGADDVLAAGQCQSARVVRRRAARTSADPLDDVDGDSDDLTEFKRGLRRVADHIKLVVKGRCVDAGVMEAARGQVQALAGMVASSQLVAAGAQVDARTEQAASSPSPGVYTNGCSSAVRAPPPLLAFSRSSNRSRGRHEARRPTTLEVFYSNVTAFSNKAEAYMIGSGHQIWMAAETHLREQNMVNRLRTLTAAGWHCFYAEAAKSEKSVTGTLGGVLAAARNHLCVKPMVKDVREDYGYRSSTTDLVGVNVPLRGAELLVYGGYARDGDYLPLLSQIAKMTRQGTVPFVLLCDFTPPPPPKCWRRTLQWQRWRRWSCGPQAA